MMDFLVSDVLRLVEVSMPERLSYINELLETTFRADQEQTIPDVVVARALPHAADGNDASDALDEEEEEDEEANDDDDEDSASDATDASPSLSSTTAHSEGGTLPLETTLGVLAALFGLKKKPRPPKVEPNSLIVEVGASGVFVVLRKDRKSTDL